ncbi:multicopper oxidase family protein [Bacillus sp. JJ722]|uniref:multicopper oxidase family protein n=1 Tax=Bacillus sp. JJ722 TaxID=3122973 RepID=UPI002FFFDD86
MKRKYLMTLALASTLIISACSSNQDDDMKGMDHSEMNQSEDSMEGMDHSEMNQADGDMDHANEQNEFPLNNSTGENELKVPPILKPDKVEGNNVYYTIETKKGKTEIFKGYETSTLGYNSSFLGPVVKMKKGQNVYINTKNNLDEETTFHWHGLELPSDADGGPHSIIKPGEQKQISFQVQQDAATLWFHPHPKGNTAKQVFNGLAGLIYLEDEEQEQLSLPDKYGKNDFPLIIQDKSFDKDKQFNYEEVMNADGTLGDTLLVNGTVNPTLNLNKEKVRFRLVNGSNMRNYVFKLSNKQSFMQIASDGGLLNQPVELKELKLTPGERVEIIVDFSNMKEEDLALITEEGTVVLPFTFKEATSSETADTPKQMNNISISESDLNKDVSKKIELFGMGSMVTINGKKFDMDRIDFKQKAGVTEVWEIYNKPDMMGGMVHPFHIHGTQFKVISINGEKPPANLQGYKDTIALNPDDKVKIAVKFHQKGTYMYHCHILEHEENGMMGQIKIY